jgi:hypothetical protein
VFFGTPSRVIPILVGGFEIVPTSPWLRPTLGFPAPEEMHGQAKNENTKDP